MDDLKFGTRNKKGDWKPFKLSTHVPLFDWPFNPIKILKWLFGIPGYLFPWTFFYGLLAIIIWVYFTPSLSAMKNFHYDWILFILIRNLIITIFFAGGLHFFLYIKKNTR